MGIEGAVTLAAVIMLVLLVILELLLRRISVLTNVAHPTKVVEVLHMLPLVLLIIKPEVTGVALELGG